MPGKSLRALVVAVILGSGLSFGSPIEATPTKSSPNCPVSTTYTTSYTGLIEAPGTTYPYTTTVVIDDVIYPTTTYTTTDKGTWTYHGTTSTYAVVETVTSTNYYGPFPGCY